MAIGPSGSRYRRVSRRVGPAIGPRGSLYRRIAGAFGVVGSKSKATLTTALAGTNNDLKFTAVERGTDGNSITVAYAVAGTSTPLSVDVTGDAITVNVATDGAGAATSTAAEVRDAVNADADANDLVVAENAADNDGTGVVTALAATALAGGTNWTSGTY